MRLGGTYATNRVLTAGLDNMATRRPFVQRVPRPTALRSTCQAEAPPITGAWAGGGVPRGSSRPRLHGEEPARGLRVRKQLERQNKGHGTSDRYHSAMIVFARDFGMSPLS